jgi:hypothetical protein
MTRGWRKLHDEDIHNFYSSPNDVIMIKSACSMYGENRNVI